MTPPTTQNETTSEANDAALLAGLHSDLNYKTTEMNEANNNLDINSLDLDKLNAELRDLPADEIVQWALSLSNRNILTTSFSPNAAAMLHLVTLVEPSLPVVWVDTGYNLRDTYVVAEKLVKSLGLNLLAFSPLMTSERRNAIMGGIPTIEEEEQHKEFTRQVKLEPFERALTELNPEVWLTGIRSEETAHRKTLDIISVDGRGILKVAPFFYWSSDDLDAYMSEHELISCRHYFDPTKVQEGRECGMHTSA